MRKFLAALWVVAVSAGLASAGQKAGEAPDMEAMMAEMMKCAVCKSYGARMAEIGPMETEVVDLDNGMAVVHKVKNETGLKAFHEAHDLAAKAGAASISMSDEAAKTQLCHLCQQMRDTVKKGASMSTGKTKMGDMLVLTSSDPALQKEIASVQMQCEAMAGHMDEH